ncbi:hypothetical protein L1987_29997 [Smallanthus sonchifolius]|uniref:Uncharacterized protein n=1 Tax=Smallanthus sonchifolius TaxID=185202 RepID=A0ACB9I310_9ASTR|nr:hypothetical protein L1987_29997 [Smallanthus sonchifolius]
MVFVPFTGIDNHNNNVTFGAALLGSETTDTYVWLLKNFLKAFGKEPKVVVTDQNPAMRKAIEEVFTKSRHRLCTWHVMNKLSMKVGANLCNSTDFKEDICSIVWTDALTPEQFASGWASLIEKFNLSDNEWLVDMFDLRHSWIPAFYRDDYMAKADEVQIVAPPPSKRDRVAELIGHTQSSQHPASHCTYQTLSRMSIACVFKLKHIR